MIRQTKKVQIENLFQLQPGQKLEALRGTITYYRGCIDQTAPGLDVLWIREEPSGDRKMLHFNDYSLWLLEEQELENAANNATRDGIEQVA